MSQQPIGYIVHVLLDESGNLLALAHDPEELPPPAVGHRIVEMMLLPVIRGGGNLLKPLGRVDTGKPADVEEALGFAHEALATYELDEAWTGGRYIRVCNALVQLHQQLKTK